ncbi:MAG: phospholipid carrier-dependent glycosyltransferase [Chloroflexi bacterium]|nr:phospholipid carrier-dependent glycosyltransferase [Chloroflexota bacterium]
MSDNPKRMPLNNWQRLIIVALLGVFFTQAVTTIPQLSLTADEPVEMGAGYAFLRSGDLRMAVPVQHPPLMQELMALPLLLQPGPELETLDGWNTAEMARYAPAFVAWYGDALDAATFAARMVIVWIALLWAAFLFRWAADWFGPWGGIAALTLFVFDPNILAHATLATNDVGFATFSFITIFAVTRLLSRRSLRVGKKSWQYLILAGLALGGSLGSKSSGFFTVLVLATLFPLAALLGNVNKGRARRVAGAIFQLTLILFLGVLVLWAIYGFDFRPVEGGRLAVPLATQWEVWREMRAHLDTGHTGYLIGQIRDTGWLTYYPWAVALKTPPLTLMLLVIGLVAAAAAGPRRWLTQLSLWIYLGGYTSATLLSSINIGYRFLLPMLPFGFILIAGLFRDGIPWLRQPVLRWGSWTVLVLSGILVAASLHPHYLIYFNRLAGGPTGGHHYLVDSNIDWGQSFKALKKYLDEREIDQVWLSYYTYADPALYSIRYQPIAPSPNAPPVLPSRFAPAPGVYVIGATTLQGVMVVDPDNYDWFRHREPLGRPGTALFVYQVAPLDEPPGWLAQCTTPVAPLTPEAVEEGFGRNGLRMVYFDCTTAWLYPNGGDSPGWYALFRDTARSDDPFIQTRLAGKAPSYEQRWTGTLPPFAIYEHVSQPIFPLSMPDDPIQIGHLTFLGHTSTVLSSARPGQTIDMETWWRVDSLSQRPLSIMMHLIGPGGVPVVVGDGLGVPIEQWQIGDVIVQRHTLVLPADAPAGEYIPMTGVYWLDTVERWPVERAGESIGDHLTLPTIPVTAEK